MAKDSEKFLNFTGDLHRSPFSYLSIPLFFFCGPKSNSSLQKVIYWTYTARHYESCKII